MTELQRSGIGPSGVSGGADAKAEGVVVFRSPKKKSDGNEKNPMHIYSLRYVYAVYAVGILSFCRYVYDCICIYPICLYTHAYHICLSVCGTYIYII